MVKNTQTHDLDGEGEGGHAISVSQQLWDIIELALHGKEAKSLIYQ